MFLHPGEAELRPSGIRVHGQPAPVSSPESQTIRIVPKGLRSFDEHDADFFLELLPGPRARDGLPESIRFWKTRIEESHAEKTFRVGLMYGPSGSGKSSLLRAGLLPRLDRKVVPIWIEATAKDTEFRLLRAIRKQCPDLPIDLGLVDTLAIMRRGRVLPTPQKLLIVIDQLEQWLNAQRSDEEPELVAALRQCDGEHLQALVSVRDDFWLAVSRFMANLQVELVQGKDVLLIDLFDLRHARKVLTAFGQAYGAIPENAGDLARDQEAFLDRSVSALSNDGRVVPVWLTLFAEMVKTMPWRGDTLSDVGGTEGIGATFLEESFCSPRANPKHRRHLAAARAVLEALLPQSGTDIRGQLRSDRLLQQVCDYADRPRDFSELMQILDAELRLITPTEPGQFAREEEVGVQSIDRYYQLTHDYLVPSLRNWLTRKQRETRRGRAELQLAASASNWLARPDNRHLPSAIEWVNIRVLTKRKDWSDAERKVMKRAGRVHGTHTLLLLIFLGAATFGGLKVRDRIAEDRQATHAAGLVRGLLNANITHVPDFISEMRGYRRWVDRPLRDALRERSVTSRERLHASLALLPTDPGQADYLSNRLLEVTAIEQSVIWQSLKEHGHAGTDRFWAELKDQGADPDRRFHAACVLANSNADEAEKNWEEFSPFVANEFLSRVIRTPSDYAVLIEMLRPIGKRLSPSMATEFRNSRRSDIERNFALTVLVDYANDDVNLLTQLLLESDAKAFALLLPSVRRQASMILPALRAEIAKEAKYEWSDIALDRTWTDPDPAVVRQIELSKGLISERFAFCQDIPLDEFLTAAETLRKSGYRPMRLRPFAGERAVHCAALWTRDSRKWRMRAALSAGEFRRYDESCRLGEFIPVDVAGYVVSPQHGKPNERYAGVWVERSSADDDAMMYFGVTSKERPAEFDRLTAAGMVPVTMQETIASDNELRYSGVSRRVPNTSSPPPYFSDLSQPRLTEELASNAGHTLLDLGVFGAGPTVLKRAASVHLKILDASLKKNPLHVNARFARARLLLDPFGEDRRALDDLVFLVESTPTRVDAIYYRTLAYARLGQKKQALESLENFRNQNASEIQKLCLGLVVAAELAEGRADAVARLESAVKRQSNDPNCCYDAACAYALAAHAADRTDDVHRATDAERAIQLLQQAIDNGYSDFGKLAEDPDLLTVRGLPPFSKIVAVAGRLDCFYSAVWSDNAQFEGTPVYGLDPDRHLERCEELIAHGFRPVSIAMSHPEPPGPPVTASVWHRPVVSNESRDGLAMRQAALPSP